MDSYIHNNSDLFIFRITKEDEFFKIRKLIILMMTKEFNVYRKMFFNL